MELSPSAPMSSIRSVMPNLATVLTEPMAVLSARTRCGVSATLPARCAAAALSPPPPDVPFTITSNLTYLKWLGISIPSTTSTSSSSSFSRRLLDVRGLVTFTLTVPFRVAGIAPPVAGAGVPASMDGRAFSQGRSTSWYRGGVEAVADADADEAAVLDVEEEVGVEPVRVGDVSVAAAEAVPDVTVCYSYLRMGARGATRLGFPRPPPPPPPDPPPLSLSSATPLPLQKLTPTITELISPCPSPSVVRSSSPPPTGVDLRVVVAGVAAPGSSEVAELVAGYNPSSPPPGHQRDGGVGGTHRRSSDLSDPTVFAAGCRHPSPLQVVSFASHAGSSPSWSLLAGARGRVALGAGSTRSPSPHALVAKSYGGASADQSLLPELQSLSPPDSLEMAVEMVTLLDMAEERRVLSTAERSLREFLQAKISSLMSEVATCSASMVVQAISLPASMVVQPANTLVVAAACSHDARPTADGSQPLAPCLAAVHVVPKVAGVKTKAPYNAKASCADSRFMMVAHNGGSLVAGRSVSWSRRAKKRHEKKHNGGMLVAGRRVSWSRRAKKRHENKGRRPRLRRSTYFAAWNCPHNAGTKTFSSVSGCKTSRAVQWLQLGFLHEPFPAPGDSLIK
ncbi:hypothetical protein EJB05_39671, partial [Eragrostis curvula]